MTYAYLYKDISEFIYHILKRPEHKVCMWHNLSNFSLACVDFDHSDILPVSDMRRL